MSLKGFTQSVKPVKQYCAPLVFTTPAPHVGNQTLHGVVIVIKIFVIVMVRESLFVDHVVKGRLVGKINIGYPRSDIESQLSILII